MEMRVGAALRSRLWAGFLLSALLAVLACGVGLFRFAQIEAHLTRLNQEQMPFLRALNQLDGAFFLLEADLDKLFLEEAMRPRDTLFADWDRRWSAVEDMNAGSLRAGVDGFGADLVQIREVVDSVYADWPRRKALEARLSELRATGRASLKRLVRNAEASIRESSELVQAQSGRSGILVAGILGASFVVLVLLSWFLVRTLQPLGDLAAVVRRISVHGLDEGDVAELAGLSHEKNEVGILSSELARMASSLRDRSRALQQQQKVLERAHEEMAVQNEELRSARDKLAHQEKLAIAGRLAAQMAHEVRNPLNALGLHLEVLDHDLRARGVVEPLLAPVKREVERLARVTDAHLELARAPRFQRDSVDMTALLSGVEETWGPLFREKGVQLLMERSALESVAMDQGSLSQVMGNLLKNALEAFDSESKALKFVRVTGQKRGGNLEINVLDNGAGIRKDMAGKMFEPFFTTKAQGTGLGLAHCRQLLEKQGGEILFESSEGRGTKFTLRLPLVESVRGNV